MPRIPEYADDRQINYIFNPSNANKATVHYRIDLECRTGGSDKVYIVFAYESQGMFHATAFYGKRGGSLNTNQKGTYNSSSTAIRIAQQMASAKMAGKGSSRYTKVNEEFPTSAQVSFNTNAPASLDSISVGGDVLGPAPRLSDLFQGTEDLKPSVDFITDKQAKNRIADDRYIMEPRMSLGFHYGLLAESGLYIYESDKLSGGTYKSIASIALPHHTDIKTLGINSPAIFVGDYEFVHGKSRFAIFDVVKMGEVKGVNIKEWAARRTMLKFMLEDLFPNQDVYDPNACDIYLQDIEHDNKDHVFINTKFRYYVFKNIADSFSKKWHVYEN